MMPKEAIMTSKTWMATIASFIKNLLLLHPKKLAQKTGALDGHIFPVHRSHDSGIYEACNTSPLHFNLELQTHILFVYSACTTACTISLAVKPIFFFNYRCFPRIYIPISA